MTITVKTRIMGHKFSSEFVLYADPDVLIVGMLEDMTMEIIDLGGTYADYDHSDDTNSWVVTIDIYEGQQEGIKKACDAMKIAAQYSRIL